jgi:hypothetical protein
VIRSSAVQGFACACGALLKLGFEVAQSSVAKYMIQRPDSPSQGWLTFRNHSTQIAAMDLFVVPSITFALLYVSSLSGRPAEILPGAGA